MPIIFPVDYVELPREIRFPVIALSENGERLLISDDNLTEFICCHIPSRTFTTIPSTIQLANLLYVNNYRAIDMVFFPDNTRAAVSFCQGIVLIMDVLRQQILHRLEHRDPLGNKTHVTSCSVSRDGKLLACGSFDKKVRIWDTNTGQLKKTCLEHTELVHSVVFGADKLITTDHNNQLMIRGMDGKLLKRAIQSEQVGNGIQCCVISPDNKWLVYTSNDGYIRVRKFSNLGDMRKFKAPLSNPSRLIFNAQGNMLLSYNSSGLCLWNVGSWNIRAILKYNGHIINHCRFTADGSQLVSVCSGNKIYFWDIATLIRHQEAMGKWERDPPEPVPPLNIDCSIFNAML